MSKDMWNQRYADAEYVYGTGPNLFFKEQIDLIQPGRILLPAEGEGRNAVYAAEKGWEVNAFDQSEEGMVKAKGLAALSGVSIGYEIADLSDFSAVKGQYDLIALIFVHIPQIQRRVIHRNLLHFLKPGGTLLLTGFAKEQVKNDSGGPKDPSMLFSVDELTEDFSGMNIRSVENLQVEISEGRFHQGTADIIQLVAVKQD